MIRRLFLLTLASLIAGPILAGDLRVQGQLISETTSGPPLAVSSSDVVSNLNADRLDGFNIGDFAVEGSGVGVHYKNLVGVPGEEIDQDCAVNTGCFPGDSAGFPVTIDEPGSYRLAGNLETSDEDTAVILIRVPAVTLDLSGFSIRGPVTCSGFPVSSCSPTDGTGNGIVVSGVSINAHSVVIRNGTVRGMGHIGIWCSGVPCLIEGIAVAENDDVGILVTSSLGAISDCLSFRNGGDGIRARGIIRRCRVDSNGVDGIDVAKGTTVEESAIRRNGNIGINGPLTDDCIIVNNTVNENGDYGISVGEGSTVSGNTVSENGRHGISAHRGSVVSGNTVRMNDEDGLWCEDCLLLDNVIADNLSEGIRFFGSESSWGGNLVFGHASNVVLTAGVFDRGGNVCGGSAC